MLNIKRVCKLQGTLMCLYDRLCPVLDAWELACSGTSRNCCPALQGDSPQAEAIVPHLLLGKGPTSVVGKREHSNLPMPMLVLCLCPMQNRLLSSYPYLHAANELVTRDRCGTYQ